MSTAWPANRIGATALAVVVLISAAFILQHFLLSIAWAGVLAIATWPIYVRWEKRFGRARAAVLSTAVVAICTIVPLAWLSTIAVHEVHAFVAWLKVVDQTGFAFPDAFSKLPQVIVVPLREWWNDTLAVPNGPSDWLRPEVVRHLAGSSTIFRGVALNAIHRIAALAFALVMLFFMFRDGLGFGNALLRFIRQTCGDAWSKRVAETPRVVRATVDGLVVVGIGVGVLIGIAGWIVGFPSPALLAAATAAAATIPFAAPIVFGGAALWLAGTGAVIPALIFLAWSAAVMFVADHFVRPKIIGDGARLPFWAVLFGVLGGVEVFGLIGLFLGPAAMALLAQWWRAEASDWSATVVEPDPD
ncbi:MAG: AI-2E family transporter [Betaproteobacteria bacterium]